MDLTPREDLDAGGDAVGADPDALRKRMQRGRRTKVAVAAVVLVVIAGFVVIQGLRNATLFFRNVDEAIEQRDDLGDRRFRLQGRVIPASVRSDGGVTTFEVVHNCRIASVQHLTDPPELFESPWIPVVLEGNWSPGAVETFAGGDDHFFLSDRMLVKHTNEYASAHEERVTDAPPEGFLDGCSPDLQTAVEQAAP